MYRCSLMIWETAAPAGGVSTLSGTAFCFCVVVPKTWVTYTMLCTLNENKKLRTLDHHPRAAVHRNAAISNSSELLTISAPIKISWWHLKWFKSYRANKHTHTHTDTDTILKTIPPSLRRYRCVGNNKKICNASHSRRTRARICTTHFGLNLKYMGPFWGTHQYQSRPVSDRQYPPTTVVTAVKMITSYLLLYSAVSENAAPASERSSSFVDQPID